MTFFNISNSNSDEMSLTDKSERNRFLHIARYA